MQVRIFKRRLRVAPPRRPADAAQMPPKANPAHVVVLRRNDSGVPFGFLLRGPGPVFIHSVDSDSPAQVPGARAVAMRSHY